MLTEVSGNPSVLVVHHSSKLSRLNGQPDVRGVTALSESFRWVAQLGKKDGAVELSIEKTSYAPPSKPVRLVRGTTGVLTLETDVQREQRDQIAEDARQAELDRDIERVVEALRLIGKQASKDSSLPPRG